MNHFDPQPPLSRRLRRCSREIAVAAVVTLAAAAFLAGTLWNGARDRAMPVAAVQPPPQ